MPHKSKDSLKKGVFLSWSLFQFTKYIHLRSLRGNRRDRDQSTLHRFDIVIEAFLLCIYGVTLLYVDIIADMDKFIRIEDAAKARDAKTIRLKRDIDVVKIVVLNKTILIEIRKELLQLS